uniref:Translocator protein n=1 Tax=Molossus molossus TaxID=27622 RepID=A0A7J8G2A8_MOLMO|nr:translocator protein [Molossus molossus]
MASHLLWQPTNGLGPGGHPADGGVGNSYRRGLAPGEPLGRSIALPIPGLAGLWGHAQLLHLAGQPWPAWWPKACGMRYPTLRRRGCCQTGPAPGGGPHTFVATKPVSRSGSQPRGPPPAS